MEHRSTILIVDDHAIGRTTLESLLLCEGYHLVMASNGMEALAKAAELLPDLMLLDIMMPDMDGIEVCRRLRSDPQLADMPVIMVTALDDGESRLLGIEAGADDFISKPFNRIELRTRIRTITRLNRYRRLALEREQRQLAEDRTRRQLERMATLHAIDMEIATRLEKQTVLSMLVEQLHTRLGIDAIAVSLVDSTHGRLEHAVSYGFATDTITYAALLTDQEFGSPALLNRSPICIPDRRLQQQAVAMSLHNGTVQAHDGQTVEHSLPMQRTHTIMQHAGFVAYYAMPLIARGQTRGMLEFFHHTPIAPDIDWLDFLETLAAQTAITLDNAELFETLQQSYDATLQGWVKALDLRDKETEGHSQRVTELTVRLARAMGLAEAEIESVRRGALLHDIGKLGIPDSILLKPGALTDEEWQIMRTHPVLAYEWLAPIDYLRSALDIPYCHHEKWDGSGYPQGLSREQIPLSARLFAVIDVWDALSSDRPYRKRWPQADVCAYLREQAGKHFDPDVVEVFLHMVQTS